MKSWRAEWTQRYHSKTRNEWIRSYQDRYWTRWEIFGERLGALTADSYRKINPWKRSISKSSRIYYQVAMRLDQYLVLHHAITRNKAQQLISTDLVLVNAKICNKSSFQIKENDIVSIQEDRRVHFVSRSAEKLAGFFEWSGNPIAISGSNCLDVGSSTGGFTQVLLSLGAHHVDAVDVGTDQLHESLRRDIRVSSYEQTDIRDFAKNNTKPPYHIIVCDASFISLTEIIDPILALANEKTAIILLYKPQFEVGREHLRKTGVPKEQSMVDKKMAEFESLLVSKNCTIFTRKPSSLMGEAGNQEWIYLIEKNPQK